jgi:broad specificity phosphatase PhoE
VLTAYFQRHGQTLYFEDMMTFNEQIEVIKKGIYLDLTPAGIENVCISAAQIASEIKTPVVFHSSQSLRARGTASVSMQTLHNSGIEILNFQNPEFIYDLRNYEQEPPDRPAGEEYPELFEQSLSQPYLKIPDDQRFNGRNIEGRFQSSRRALRFLGEFLNFCRDKYNENLTLFYVSHSEVLGPLLEQLFSPDLPLESTPRVGKSNEGIQRAEYFKVLVYKNKKGSLVLDVTFKKMHKVLMLDEINTHTHWFSNVYQDLKFQVKDR